MTAVDFFESNYWRIDDLPDRLIEAFLNPAEDPGRRILDLGLLFYGNRISEGAAILDLVWGVQQERELLLELFSEVYDYLRRLPTNERCHFRYFHIRKYKWLPLWYVYE